MGTTSVPQPQPARPRGPKWPIFMAWMIIALNLVVLDLSEEMLATGVRTTDWLLFGALCLLVLLLDVWLISAQWRAFQLEPPPGISGSSVLTVLVSANCSAPNVAIGLLDTKSLRAIRDPVTTTSSTIC